MSERNTGLFLILFMVISACTGENGITHKFQSDNGDGTFTNPVIAADFPDPDVIRVDSVYYFVSTSMFVFPGVPILKSYDLVNWEYCANAVQRFDFSPCYNLAGCNRYARGQWATSLRYHNGMFYLLFITLDEGGFLCTAERPEGPWEIRQLEKGYYDPGLFFDDDGRTYVAHGYNDIYITEVDAGLRPLGEDVLVYSGDIRRGLEGMHVYKIDGRYYLYGTYGGLDGFQVALRSDSIYGPYEQKVVIRDTSDGPNFGIHQGALIRTQTGEWWTMLFADSGPFGRFPSLQPVTWEDGWPVAGVRGNAVVTFRKPDVGRPYPIKNLPTSDEFNGPELGLQWGWNHNPVKGGWSLSANPGKLRLSTTRLSNDLPSAPNTLTQRMFAYYSDSTLTTGSVKLEFDGMKDGDMAGLALFQDPYAFIGVRRTRDLFEVLVVDNGMVVDSAALEQDHVYLKASAFYGSGAAPLYGGETVPGTGTATFAFSLDDLTYLPLGDVFHMRFSLSVFTGNKFCLFNYATKEPGGVVLFDWFRMAPETTGDQPGV